MPRSTRIAAGALALALVPLVGALPAAGQPGPRPAAAPATVPSTVPSTAPAPSTAQVVAHVAVPALHHPTPGSGTAGDPYFPRQGNGGYDALHYALRVRYRPVNHHLGGRAVITARATKALSSFHLDLRRSMTVHSVTVDGRAARFAQPARAHQELVVTPRHPLARGARFQVSVGYAGTALPATDPDDSLDGWIPTGDGAFVAGEPQGAPTWYPVDDSPIDKATYAVTVVVPKGLVGVSNGALVARRRHGSTTAWSWRLDRPVSSYLITASVGRFDLTTGRTPDGVPYLDAVDPTQAAASARVLRTLPAIIDYFTTVYGPYPFGQAGAIVDNAPKVGYALETATRPVFDTAPDEATLSHELAHQWFGDAVTLARWRDIWINEGFAEFSSWLWDEHSGGRSAHQHLEALLRRPVSSPIWSPPPGNPGSAAAIFSDSVYERGAGTLEALREKVGNRVFFTIMRGWVQSHRGANATVGQFTAYAARVAHRPLHHLFRIWLYRPGKP